MLTGSIPVQDLALRSQDVQLGELARPHPPAVLAVAPQDVEPVPTFIGNGITALPVYLRHGAHP